MQWTKSKDALFRCQNLQTFKIDRGASKGKVERTETAKADMIALGVRVALPPAGSEYYSGVHIQRSNWGLDLESYHGPHSVIELWKAKQQFSPVQFTSVAQSCSTLCDPMNSSTPGLPVHHQLPEFTQTRVHWVGDAIQPSHPLSSPSPPAPNLSQHQSLFQWVNSSHEVAKVLELQL